ncbi:MAG: hypothetical protein M3R17_02110 [Bacteroidota bacterium]|nr:hypothetical protein [Bacteroidota bacterium]
MKNYFTLVLLLIFCSANAQVSEKDMKKHLEKVAKSKAEGSVVRSLDTIFNAGIPYAILKDKKVMLASDYTLFSLNGKELVDMPYQCIDDANSASNQTCYHAFLFLQSGKRAEIIIGLGMKIERIIVEFDLVKNNDINPAGENKFVMRYPPKYSNKPQNTTVVIINNGVPGNYATVERNRSGGVNLYGTELKQDFKTIGTVTKSNSSSNGEMIYTVSYFLPNGIKIAEATGRGINCKEWRVVTMKDNQSHTITTTFSQQEEQIAKFLSDSYYL